MKAFARECPTARQADMNKTFFAYPSHCGHAIKSVLFIPFVLYTKDDTLTRAGIQLFRTLRVFLGPTENLRTTFNL